MRTPFYVLILLVACVASGRAQRRAATNSQAVAADTSRLLAVRVTGSTRFQQKELVAATGLSLGANVDEASMKGAADRLAGSGMFIEVSYQYTRAAGGTSMEYKVSDVADLLPVYFDNFVWMPHDALMAELKQREPLFTGAVPNEGEMAQHLAEEVEAILRERGVAGAVKQMPMSPQQGGSITGFLYVVEGVKLPVERVELAGVSPEMMPVLRKVIDARLLHTEFSESHLQTFLEFDLLPQYWMRGYLKAAVEHGGGELMDAASGAVAVKFESTEGVQYKLAGVTWEGNSAVPSGELATVVTVKVGAPADGVQLDTDIAKAQKLFSERGYMEARLHPKPAFDERAQTVSYTVQVNEGPQYRMGRVRFEGLSETAASQLRSRWTLAPGAVFDSGYSNRFFQDAARQLDFRHVKVEIREVPHRDSKTVDVVLLFSPRA